MHRAAYLLYKHRETIKSENILLLSPNNVFKDYISDVLPDLGERNVNIYTTVELYMPLLTRLKTWRPMVSGWRHSCADKKE